MSKGFFFDLYLDQFEYVINSIQFNILAADYIGTIKKNFEVLIVANKEFDLEEHKENLHADVMPPTFGEKVTRKEIRNS
jgi:hypothetical protein